MAADNKTLGRFSLDGIPPAPKQVPQIEVTFDIDANGIVNVYAKDKGTGKEQHITITASSNMSKEDVDKAIADAEKYAAEDKKRRESIETKNNAEQLIYQCEKTITDMGDKLSAEEKAPVEEQITKLKETLKGTDTEAIKADTDELQKRFYKIAEKMYAESQTAGAAGQTPGSDAGTAQANVNDDGTINVDDYKVNEDDNNK